MLRIAIRNVDPENPDYALFQNGAPFGDDQAALDAALAEAEAEYPVADGFEHIVQELVTDNPDAPPEEQTATWTTVT